MSEPLELAESWVNQVWQRGDLSYAELMCAENFTDFSMPDSEEGDCAALGNFMRTVRGAFPDLQAEIMDSFQDDGYIILRILFTGAHESDYMEFAPTRKRLEWQSIDILHFDNDLLMERWSLNDLRQELEAAQDDFGDMQESAEHADLIARLADVPLQVRAAIRNQGVQSASEKGWSTAATVAHLWRVERQVWQARLEEMAQNDAPEWEYWDADQYDWEAEFGATDTNVLLDAFEFLRNATCAYLRELDGEGWARRGMHRVYGELDVAALMQKAVEHDQEHLVTLEGAQL